MKHKLSTLFLLLFISLSIRAVDNLRMLSAWALASGGNVATQSIRFNPALLELSNGKQIDLQYANRYTIEDLSSVSTSFYAPNPTLSWGVDISSFGYDEYRQSLFRMVLAKRLHAKWSMGISLQYGLLQSVLSETNDARVSVDVGFTFKPVDKLLLGMLINNLPSIGVSKGEHSLAPSFMGYRLQLGFQYEVVERVLLMGSMETSQERSVAGSAGLRYFPMQGFSLAAGVQGYPLQPTGGLSYTFSRFRADVAACYHTTLGASTSIGLSYTF